MNLAHLYYFKKLVEVRNYSEAAKELFIAQPTLSLAVSSLEKELGTALVKKKRNSLELTEDGEDFYEAVVKATNALDNSIAMIQERTQAQHGTIKIGMVYSVQNQAWSNAIKKYKAKTHGKVQIRWKQGTTESLMRDLKNGTLDVIFAGVLGKGDPDVVSVPCFAQGAALLVNKANPLSQREKISFDDLGSAQIITYRNKKGPFMKEINDLFANHQSLNVAYDYGDEITLASMVSADPEILAVSCYSWLIDAFPEVATIELAEAPKDFHRFYFSYRKKERLPFAVEEFVQFMRDYDFESVSEEEVRSHTPMINI